MLEILAKIDFGAETALGVPLGVLLLVWIIVQTMKDQGGGGSSGSSGRSSRSSRTSSFKTSEM